jgi:hypothetical protein
MTPEPRQSRRLDDVVNAAKPGMRIAGTLLPIFQREDFNKHVDYIIKEDLLIASYVKRNPLYRKQLYAIAEEKYPKYRPYMMGSKFIDSSDRLTSGLSELAEIFPGIGQVISFVEEGIEMIPKLIYAPLYAKGTGDYKSLAYFATAEAASTIPVVGDLVDMQNLYVDRVRKTFRKSVAEEFLDRVSPGRSRRVN